MDKRIKEILISEKEIKNKIELAAEWLNDLYKDKNPIIIGILKGCIPFIGNIMPKLKFDYKIEFITTSSFKGNVVGNNPSIIDFNMNSNIKDQDVIILEDIIDTARTLKLVIDKLYELGAKSIKIVTLIDKKEGRKVKLDSDYSCFNIPNKFIVGFGLDYQEIMRNLPYIGILKDEYILSTKVEKEDK